MVQNQGFINFSERELVDKIQSGNLVVCVVGIGRIGLPTALSFARSGLVTIGVDINEQLVETISKGQFPLKDEPGYETIFEQVIRNNKFSATTKIEEAAPKSDVIILSLPTPMDKSNLPDYSAIKSVSAKLTKLLKPGSLVIIESTVEPGFVENELVSVIAGGIKKLDEDFGIGVCPETANPGQIMNDFEKLPRLVGATSAKVQNIILKIYRHVFTVDLIPMPDCKTANAVKLTTNVFRDLNIAFVNELALLFERIGIDINHVLEAAKSKYNFQVHYPGPGVGGPCLPVNSYQLLNLSKKFGSSNLKLVETSRKINESMPDHVIKLLQDAYKQIGNSIKGSTVLLLGASYKPDVKDIQLSPAEIIYQKLQDLGANVKIYDPYFKSENIFGIKAEENLIDILSDIDSIILVTSHKEFHDIEPTFLKSKMKNPIFIDTHCVMDQHAAKKAGLVYYGVGRGKL